MHIWDNELSELMRSLRSLPWVINSLNAQSRDVVLRGPRREVGMARPRRVQSLPDQPWRVCAYTRKRQPKIQTHIVFALYPGCKCSKSSICTLYNCTYVGSSDYKYNPSPSFCVLKIADIYLFSYPVYWQKRILFCLRALFSWQWKVSTCLRAVSWREQRGAAADWARRSRPPPTRIPSPPPETGSLPTEGWRTSSRLKE